MNIVDSVNEQMLMRDCILKKNEERLKQIVDNMREVFWLRDILSNKILYINPGIESIWGILCKDVYANEAMFFNPIYENDRSMVIDAYSNLSKTGYFDIEYRIKDVKGNIRWIHDRAFPVIDDSGRIIKATGMALDITKQKEFEFTLEILINMAKKFINIPIEDLSKEVDKALTLMGKFVNADRAYIFEYDFSLGICKNTFEWCEDGITPEIENLQEVGLEDIPEWVSSHKAGKEMCIEDVFSMSEDNGIRQILEPQGVLSVLTLPLMEKDELWGFVGFDSVKRRHVYTEKERNILGVFCELLVNVRARMNTLKEIHRAREIAEDASKSKSLFLANMSHEIRTPLNGVIGFTDLLMNTELNSIQMQYTKDISISAKSLLNTINDILDFSKIEAGKLEIESVETDIFEVLYEAIDIIKYDANQKNLELILDVSPDIPRVVKTDMKRLKQILINLLGNAVKFTHKGYIKLSLNYLKISDEKGRFDFSVKDTGIGIDEDEREKLFKAFSQADSSTTRKYGGTGLGLIISDMLTKKMGGKIYLESTKGEGSEFYFALEMEHDIHSSNTMYIENEIEAIIIDDNIEAALSIQKLLQAIGFKCKLFENGISALKEIQDNKADIIVIDKYLPYMDGIQISKYIRDELKKDKYKTSIILLGKNLDEIDDNFKMLDLNFLSKPIKFDEIIETIRSNMQISGISNDRTIKSINLNSPNSNKFNKCILIAEDVITNRTLVRSIIETYFPNVEILESNDGNETIKLLNERGVENIDMILMDIQMPNMDGFEATQIIRGKFGGEDIPIIALTAGVFKEDKEKAFEIGINEFLSKPLDVKKLVSIINKYLVD